MGWYWNRLDETWYETPIVPSDFVCPIACGECCDLYWRDVVVPVREGQLACQHLGATGCTLPRANRPPGCRDFACERAFVFVRR